jgi:membrane-bound ClpP family serine protease
LDPVLIVTLAYLAVGVVVLFGTSWHEGLPLEGLVFLVVLLWPAILVLWLVGWRLALRPAERGASADGSAVVGQFGVTVRELRPTGKVEVAGRTHDARADEYIARGVRVVVVGVGGFGLRVHPAPDTVANNAEAKSTAS